MTIGDLLLALGAILSAMTAGFALAGIWTMDDRNAKDLGPFALRFVVATAMGGTALLLAGGILKGFGL